MCFNRKRKRRVRHCIVIERLKQPYLFSFPKEQSSQDHLIFLFRYIVSADCNEEKFYICSTLPSTEEIDVECPKGYYHYKSDCLKPSPRTMTLELAIVSD